MEIALLGSSGMLGQKMADRLKESGHFLLTPSRSEVDLSRPFTIERFFKKNSFEMLINCAAFTRVDACEEPSWYSEAMTVNGVGVGWLAKFCKKTKRMLVHFSTDYVFNGEKEDPYQETDEPDPVNAYGRTKRQGEKLITAENSSFYLIRTSWLFGPGGRNFATTMLDLLRSKPKVEVVTDQVGSPTYTGDLAQFVLELFEKKAPYGIYHFANQEYASWYDFALEIQKQTGLKECKVVPTLSENVHRPAKRPANSSFDLSKAVQAVGHPFRPWMEALSEYLTKEIA